MAPLARAAAAAALLAACALAAPDACTYKDELTCLQAGGRTDYACAWCKSAAIPSSCATLAEAQKLPPGAFECGNSTRTDCDLMKTVDDCSSLVGCLWCTSKTVKPICGNYMNTSTLPKSVFTCAGPYEEAPAAPAAPAAEGDAAPGQYDFFLLEQQWAITECQDVFKCPSKPTGAYMTLHGLWPERTDGSYPQSCGGSFDPSKIQKLLPALNTYWPSLNGPSDTFWQHEYEKHGTCCTDVFPDELSYFNGTLALPAQYNITSALAAHGIYPSNTKSFQLTAFNAALKAEYGQSAVLTCDSQHRIETAVQCISKSGAIMACPASVKGACSGGLAYLPSSMP